MRTVHQVGFGLAVLAGLGLPMSGRAQYAISSASPSEIPAGATDTVITLQGTLPAYPSNTYGVCFYTAYGSSATPISLFGTSFDVPDDDVLKIPPSAFSGQTFTASVYIASLSETCNGTPQLSTNVYPIPIELPSISGFTPSEVQAVNPVTNVQAPPLLLNFQGINFSNSSLVYYDWGTGGSPGTTKSFGPTSVNGYLTTQPANASGLNASVCTVSANYTYCSTATDVPIHPLVASSGTLTATPDPSNPGDAVTLTAKFSQTGYSTTPVGAPTGVATFTDNGSTLGTAPLVLDPTNGGLSQAYQANMSALSGPAPKLVDVNGDGLKDLAYFDNSGNFYVQLGAMPYGTFGATVMSQPDPDCMYVDDFAVADVNGDGIPDLVFTCEMGGPDETEIALGNGDGTVSPANPIYGVYGSVLKLGDVNGDKKPDIVVEGQVNDCFTSCDAAYGFQVLSGNGFGYFELVQTSTTNNYPGSEFVLADFDGDGALDVATLNPGSSGNPSIDIYLNQGNGMFGTQNGGGQSPNVSVALDSSAEYQSLATGDFNGDGKPDLAVGSDGSNGSQVIYAYNTGTPALFSGSQAFNIPNYAYSIAAADFNGDGLSDIAVTDYTGLTVYDSTGTAFATDYAGLTATASNRVVAGLVGDTNFDGDADYVLITETGQLSVTPPRAAGVKPAGPPPTEILTSYLTTGAANAKLVVKFAGAGSQPVAAAWPGNVDLSASTANNTFSVNGGMTATSVVLNGTPTEYGQTASFTATVSSAAGTPTGQVTFYSDGGMLGTLTLTAGSATLSTAALTAGSHVITASYLGNPAFNASGSAPMTQQVTKATPRVSWTPTVATIAFGTPLSGAQLDATVSTTYFATIPGTFSYTPPSGTTLGAGPRSLQVLFTPTDTADFNTAMGNTTITVTKVMPTVTWSNPSPITYGTALSSTQLDASSSVAGTYVYMPAAGTVLGVGSNQPLSVSFTPSDTTDYNNAVGSASITVTKATPTITWNAPAPIAYGTALSATQLNATAASALGAVAGTFNYTPAAGTVLGAGNGQALSVSFTPTDAADYNAATGGTTINVTKATPTITWNAPAPIAYGTALSATQLNATAAGPLGAVAGTFNYTPAAGTVLGAGNGQALSVSFTPTDAADYNAATGGTTINVTKATPTITWNAPAPIVYGTALSATQLNATAAGPLGAVAGTFNYTPAAGTVLGAGNGQALSVSFTPTDAADYNAATGGTTINVTKATPTITWNAPAGITYGTALSATQLNATAASALGAVAGTFNYTPAAGTVLGAGNGQALSVSFTPTDAADYNAATGGTTINVAKATPTITWNAPAGITYGTALSATQLNATAAGPLGAVAGTFNYTPAAGTVLGAGNGRTLSVSFTPTDAADYNAATGGTTINVAKATPTITWNAPAAITYGTALSATQLNAAAASTLGAVAGTFVYTPASGTVLSAGNNQPLSVSFTPTDAADYNPATGATTINVGKATPTLTWSSPAPITYGTALSATQLNATATGVSGALAGTFVYTPAAGTVLNAGTQSLSVTFTPTDATDYTTGIAGTTISVGKVTPVLTWAPPAAIVVGTPLSATQLNATAAGISGALAGTFVYTPAAGTVLQAGPQSLSVTFTPTDAVDYASATLGNSINVLSLLLTSITPSTANLGDAAKTITLTGTGFLPNSVVQLNGTAIATTYVNATTLTAVIPASSLLTAQTLTVKVVDPTQSLTSGGANFVVSAPTATGVFTGPTTVQPAQQPGLTFTLGTAYPVAITGTVTLTFAGTGGVDDPAIQFASGGRTYTFTIPANSTTTPAIQLQSGTDAGTITATLTLSAGGTNITPANIQPLTIVIPPVAPSLTSATLTRTGQTITLTVAGFSNTRNATQAVFHFVAGPNAYINNPDITVDVSTLFTTWFLNPASQAYGSEFLYTQTFDLNTDESSIASVTITLTNSAGNSGTATAQ